MNQESLNKGNSASQPILDRFSSIDWAITELIAYMNRQVCDLGMKANALEPDEAQLFVTGENTWNQSSRDLEWGIPNRKLKRAILRRITASLVQQRNAARGSKNDYCGAASHGHGELDGYHAQALVRSTNALAETFRVEMRRLGHADETIEWLLAAESSEAA